MQTDVGGERVKSFSSAVGMREERSNECKLCHNSLCVFIVTCMVITGSHMLYHITGDVYNRLSANTQTNHVHTLMYMYMYTVYMCTVLMQITSCMKTFENCVYDMYIQYMYTSSDPQVAYMWNKEHYHI